MKADERRLIERAQRGDQEAFAALVEQHQRRVFSVIANLLRRPNEVEDIAQQVFFKAYRALPRFDFRASFGTWLHRIAVNECFDQLRRRRAQKSARGTEIPLGETAVLERLQVPGPANPAEQTESRQLIERLLERLSAEDRLLLTLREMEGFAVEEIAAVTRMNENTVKVRLFRARKRLLEIHRRFFRRRPK